MGITALPNPPNSGNPATFNDDADTFLGALPTMVTEINALLPSIAAKLWATLGAGSTANALVLSCGFPALAVGTQIRFRATATNTGAATINLDGLGAKACRTVTGVALPAGYIRTDADTLATYNGTYWVLDRVPEIGSNSNGYYKRLADGTQTCWIVNQTMTRTSADGFFYSWTLPAAFVDTNFIPWGTVPANASNYGTADRLAYPSVRPGTIATSYAQFTALRVYGAPSTPSDATVTGVGFAAIGRWY